MGAARVGGTRILLFDALRVKIPLRAIGGDACGGSATRHTVGEVFDCPQEYIGLPPVSDLIGRDALMNGRFAPEAVVRRHAIVRSFVMDGGSLARHSE